MLIQLPKDFIVECDSAESPSRGKAKRSHIKTIAKPELVQHAYRFTYEPSRPSKLIRPSELEAAVGLIVKRLGLSCPSARTQSLDLVSKYRVSFSVIGFDLTEDDIVKTIDLLNPMIITACWQRLEVCINTIRTAVRASFTLYANPEGAF